MQTTIAPISILEELQAIYGNKLHSDLATLTISEAPERGFFLTYTLTDDEDASSTEHFFYADSFSGKKSPDDLKKWFLTLSFKDHFFLADGIFKEEDHFEENNDFLIHYPFKKIGYGYHAFIPWLIEDLYGSNITQDLKAKILQFINKELEEDRLLDIEEESQQNITGIGIYVAEKEDFLNRLRELVPRGIRTLG